MSFEQSVIKVFIGKDIDRVVADGASFATVLGTIAAGEVVVLDKNKSAIVGATPTVSSTDTIYIVQGMDKTYDYVQPGGAAVTARAIRISDPIKGANVKSYIGDNYAAKAEKQVTVDFTTFTPDPGTEYVVRLVYKDMVEYPGQFTASYRAVAQTNSAADLADAIADRVTRHKGARVVATAAAGVLTLTAKPIPECTTSVEDVDKFTMVDFDTFVHYVDSDGNWKESGAVVTVTQEVTYGIGTWEAIRDQERSYLHGIGARNIMSYPYRYGDPQVVKDAAYDVIVIEHDAPYVAPNNQGAEVMPIVTVIAFQVDPATGAPTLGQEADVLGVLNSWMASTPKAFPAVTL